MKPVRFLIVTVLLMVTSLIFAQDAKNLKKSLGNYFAYYENPAFTTKDKMAVEDIIIDSTVDSLKIFVTEGFACQPFTPELVNQIYNSVRSLLPEPFNAYNITIYSNEYPIEELVPIHLQNEADGRRFYTRNMNTVLPWVTPKSLPYRQEGVLAGSHLCVYPSHGRYIAKKTGKWTWQRPNLYCTSEDLLTQTIVVPYLIPMLENAGAIVYSVRERDWQRNEVIVDNDTPESQGLYLEEINHCIWQYADTGFAYRKSIYMDKENPFREGTCRKAETTSKESAKSVVIWQPNIPADGNYAVYISYRTLTESIPNAEYTVIHKGIATTFNVNQRMGSGTWVYLGTFNFGPGCSTQNCVTLSNYSKTKGVVTADAVRFGGGMSKVGSGMALHNDAARYNAKWSGLPEKVYAAREGDDYSDDIMVRPLSCNYLATGSEYVPGDSGINVPIELSLAVHSDAGCRSDSTFIGSLTVNTSSHSFFNGVTAAGLSRLTSRDLADIVLSQVNSDMRRTYGQWNRRQMRDRNYGETREPQVPAIIFEMFSHQNFWDMRHAHDPNFKFNIARALYKGVGRYLHSVHRKEGEFIPQPLPVSDLSAIVEELGGHIYLNWRPTEDPLEPLALPTKYIVYTSIGNQGYDNGMITDSPSLKIEAKDGVLYRFRVAALNAGGRSMLSDEVCASFAGVSAQKILIVDNFQRMSGPFAFDSLQTCGFDLDKDPGVVDVHTPAYCGYQHNFSKSGFGREGVRGLGYSGTELEGMLLAGNTHDYSTRHAQDILSVGSYNISSCVGTAFKYIRASHFSLIDLIFGAQKEDPTALRYYKTFTPEVCSLLQQYTAQGGNIMVSGAFIGSDMSLPEERQFTEQILHYKHTDCVRGDSVPTAVYGNNVNFTLHTIPNEQSYWVRSMDVIEPIGTAFSTMLYEKTSNSAAIAYKGNDYHVMAFGFPLCCITDPETRRKVISSSVQFLLSK